MPPPGQRFRLPPPEHAMPDARADPPVDGSTDTRTAPDPSGQAPVPLARFDALADGSLTRCVHRGVPVLLCRVGDDVHAVDDACTHEDVSLSLGSLSGHRLRCPLHGAAFDVRDGAVLAEPAETPLGTHPVRVVDGWVVVDERGVDPPP